MEAAAGPEMAAVFQAAADARKLAAKSTVQDWNQATNMVITGEAAGQIMGDWAQGEFAVAGKVAGTDYTCLPGLGMNAYLSTGGDAFYFPKLDDPEKEAAQKSLAALLVSQTLFRGLSFRFWPRTPPSPLVATLSPSRNWMIRKKKPRKSVWRPFCSARRFCAASF